MNDSPRPDAYKPFVSARRPDGSPDFAPKYRVLVHRHYLDHWNEIVERVGKQAAQQFWDHMSQMPGRPDPIAQTTILRGKIGTPKGPGWSKTYHYEISGAGRINFQFHDAYTTTPDGDPHPVVFILTISYGSH